MRKLLLNIAWYFGLFAFLSPAVAQVWTYRDVLPEDNQVLGTNGSGWTLLCVASSADGVKLVAGAGNPGPVLTSADSGATWQLTTVPSVDWTSVASSADGTKLVAVALSGELYTSTDSGDTWTLRIPTSRIVNWLSVASSADGTRLVAGAAALPGIYLSSDSGATWHPTPGYITTNRWSTVASSADGTKLVAAGTEVNNLTNDLYISHDSGASWMLANVPNLTWTSVASSADGTKLVAVGGFPNGIFTSSNSGLTWKQQTNAPSENWNTVASSADGTRLVAGGRLPYGQIYTSGDSGVTWVSTNNAPTTGGHGLGWYSVASSADGRKLVALPGDISALYTLQSSTVELVAMEVTQVIQDWSNSVALIQGKETYLRAHLQLPITNVGPAKVAGARLYGTSLGGPLAGSPLSPINAGGFLNVVNVTNAGSPAIRGFFTNSLNFRLPPAWTAGTINLQLVWTNGGLLAPVNVVPTNATVTVSFIQAKVPKLAFFAVNWTSNTTVRSVAPGLLDDVRRRVLSCFPVASVDAAPNRTYNWIMHSLPFAPAVIPPLKAQQLLDAHANANVTNRIYHGGIAVTSTDKFGSSGQADIGGTVSSSYLLNTYGFTRHTPSHEIGHNLGRFHDTDGALFGPVTNSSIPYVWGACGEVSPPTPTYPLFQNVNGDLKPTLGPMTNGINGLVYGLDTLTLKTRPYLNPVLDPTINFDLMSYCPTDVNPLLDCWPSTVTYAALLGKINTTFAAKPQPNIGGGTFLLVRGTVNLTAGTASFLPFLTVSLAATPANPSPGTNYTLLALNSSGGVLQQIQFAPDESAIEQYDTSQLGDFIIPLTSDSTIHTIQLWHNGALVTSISASPHVPTVTLLSPNGGQTFTNGPVDVTWNASDLDGQPLTYVIQYSADNGVTWQTLTIDWPGSPFEVDSAELAATANGLFRVLATDGFNTGQAQSASTFIVKPHAPQLSLITPLDRDVYTADQQLFLEVEAADMQDGALSGTNVQWYSDIDGVLGQDTVVNFETSRLTQGYHTITAIARDSAGLTNSAVVHIFALHQPPPPLKLALFGTQALLAWPASYTNYVLQSSGTAAAGWLTVTNAPFVSLDQQLVVVKVSGATCFYRLLFHP